MEKIYRVGIDFEIKVQSSNSEYNNDLLPFISVIDNNEHDLIDESDIFICISDSSTNWHEYPEMLSSGMIGIFLWNDWMKKLIPPWYPFVIYDRRHLISCVKYVLVDVDRARSMIDWTRLLEFYEENFNAGLVAKNIMNAVQKAMKKAPERISTWVTEIAASVGLADMNEITLDDACKMLRKSKEWRLREKNYKITRFCVRRMLIGLGFNDVGTVDEIKFSKL